MADAAATSSLSDEQIDQLLKEAETRLTAKQRGQSEDASKALPKSNLEKAAKKEAIEPKPPTVVSSLTGNAKELSIRVAEPRRSKKEMTTKADAGPSWYNLPRTDLTPQLKRDLQILKMRDVLDSKRFYRKDNSRAAVPTFSSVGTIVEGPTDFYNTRMTKKERKRTLLEEVLETEDSTRKLKSKYGQIQEVKKSGKKGHYKKMMQKRYGRKG
ncbi:Fcf2-domain-containing protein [Xylariaceae sp. FL0662B]|nr:Fcf2-domain-containing protein [Xylariaceae sp. FL0662B]